MTRFEQKPTPFIYPAIALSVAAIFLADFFTPLGIVAWIFYLVPVVVAYFTWRPSLPGAVALIGTVLTVLGFFLSPPGGDPTAAGINRGFGIAALWILSAIGYQFIGNKLAVRKQEWLQTGQTRLSEVMVGDPTMAALGQNVLRFLAEYLDAPAGALFMEDGGRFRRVATYGVPDGASIPDFVQPGDGLLGQAIQDQRTFVVQNVPETYLVMGSALGRCVPRHLLVAPITVEGGVNAVLELGFSHPVNESDRELIERVSGSVAAAVRSARYRTLLQELLEETQRQAEELQAQSEELRVSNEELAEQSQALRESQARLEHQQGELEQTNSHLEEQAQLLEAQKADLLGAKHLLEAQARDLEQASRYKSEFLANMSHELRTPLNAALILAKQLGDNRAGNLTAEQVKHAQTIESAGRDLLSLINDVLDLSKVEAGYLSVQPQAMDLARLVEHLRMTFEPLAAQKRLRLTLQLAPDLPAKIETDPQRLEQVLKNLLTNALKFTEQGEVGLHAHRAPDGRLATAVHDTGIGIPDAQHGLIFEPFCQADGTTSRKYGGTGLGLSIARQLVHLLGGDIALVSQVGRGSTFTVLLPEVYDPALAESRSKELRPASGGPRATMPNGVSGHASQGEPMRGRVEDDRERLTGRRVILIVEDDEPFARILYDLAQEMEFQALIATSSAEALALAAQYLPSAVVLDISLPDHSGLTVLDRLKTDARTRHIPVHVVSGHDYMETALSLGAVGYMLKPVRREQLADAFRQLETRLTRRVRRVLIVEDDPAQREAIGSLLTSTEVETVGVGSTADCLDRLRSTTFDCMILDVSLPDASGFALLDTLSKEDRYAFPPVIIYTGRDLTPDEEQHLRQYAKSIIIKGAKSPERLLDEVTLFLHQVVSDLPAEQQAMLELAHRRDAALEGRHLLIAEDDVRNVFALSSVFEPTGARLQIARNGREALEALDRSLQPGGTPIDLVLMDIMMPELDGLAAMRKIRTRTEWNKLPIIALTAKAMKHDQEQALAAGANDYMAKPLDVDKLLSLVRVWMPR